jgi:hypothetical protein
MISEVKTVVRSKASVDITNYCYSQLPLVDIIEARETPSPELTSMRQMSFLDLVLRVYFIEWAEWPGTEYENLVKKIRDAIGNNFTLDGAANAAWVVEVSEVTGVMPLYHLDIRVRVKYYLELEDT